MFNNYINKNSTNYTSVSGTIVKSHPKSVIKRCAGSSSWFKKLNNDGKVRANEDSRCEEWLILQLMLHTDEYIVVEIVRKEDLETKEDI